MSLHNLSSIDRYKDSIILLEARQEKYEQLKLDLFSVILESDTNDYYPGFFYEDYLLFNSLNLNVSKKEIENLLRIESNFKTWCITKEDDHLIWVNIVTTYSCDCAEPWRQSSKLLDNLEEILYVSTLN